MIKVWNKLSIVKSLVYPIALTYCEQFVLKILKITYIKVIQMYVEGNIILKIKVKTKNIITPDNDIIVPIEKTILLS